MTIDHENHPRLHDTSSEDLQTSGSNVRPEIDEGTIAKMLGFVAREDGLIGVRFVTTTDDPYVRAVCRKTLKSFEVYDSEERIYKYLRGLYNQYPFLAQMARPYVTGYIARFPLPIEVSTFRPPIYINSEGECLKRDPDLKGFFGTWVNLGTLGNKSTASDLLRGKQFLKEMRKRGYKPRFILRSGGDDQGMTFAFMSGTLIKDLDRWYDSHSPLQWINEKCRDADDPADGMQLWLPLAGTPGVFLDLGDDDAYYKFDLTFWETAHRALDEAWTRGEQHE